MYEGFGHALRPENWTFKCQANLGDIERDYGTTFREALKDSAPSVRRWT
jgi:hypothetical protein